MCSVCSNDDDDDCYHHYSLATAIAMTMRRITMPPRMPFMYVKSLSSHFPRVCMRAKDETKNDVSVEIVGGGSAA